MRTTLDIDEEILNTAARFAKGKSKKAVVEEALQEFARIHAIELLRTMIGNEEWAIDMTPEELRRFRGCDGEDNLPD